MQIQWNVVTWYSKLLAIVLFIIILPTLTFYFGMRYQDMIVTKKLLEEKTRLQEEKIKNIEIQRMIDANASSINVVSPNTTVSLCAGENYTIKWNSKNASSVLIRIGSGAGSTIYQIADYPATLNESNTPGLGEYVWKVGETKGGYRLSSGYYKIYLSVTDKLPWTASDESDQLFNIQDCKGQ